MFNFLYLAITASELGDRVDHTVVSLGLSTSVDIKNPNLDQLLKNALPETRYTIGSISIVPTVHVVDKILAGVTNLSQDEIKNLLICEAAFMQLKPEECQKYNKHAETFYVKENPNVGYNATYKAFIAYSGKKAIAELNTDKLNAAYEFMKKHWQTL